MARLNYNNPDYRCSWGPLCMFPPVADLYDDDDAFCGRYCAGHAPRAQENLATLEHAKEVDDFLEGLLAQDQASEPEPAYWHRWFDG